MELVYVLTAFASVIGLMAGIIWSENRLKKSNPAEVDSRGTSH